jgi:hypothetical protein
MCVPCTNVTCMREGRLAAPVHQVRASWLQVGVTGQPGRQPAMGDGSSSSSSRPSSHPAGSWGISGNLTKRLPDTFIGTHGPCRFLNLA